MQNLQFISLFNILYFSEKTDIEKGLLKFFEKMRISKIWSYFDWRVFLFDRFFHLAGFNGNMEPHIWIDPL